MASSPLQILSAQLRKALAQMEVVRNAINWVHEVQAELLQDHITSLVHNTTAMHADVIHVMDRGRIVESGSHERLLTQSGLYSESWSRQMMSVQSV